MDDGIGISFTVSDWIFPTKNKGDVRIVWTERDEVIVWTVSSPPELIGSITFTHIEGADRHIDDHYLVTNMYLDGPNGSGDYKRQGIGEEIISNTCIRVRFHVDDGNRRDDGGHLTGDGPGFAAKMVAKGFAYWEEGDE